MPPRAWHEACRESRVSCACAWLPLAPISDGVGRNVGFCWSARGISCPRGTSLCNENANANANAFVSFSRIPPTCCRFARFFEFGKSSILGSSFIDASRLKMCLVRRGVFWSLLSVNLKCNSNDTARRKRELARISFYVAAVLSKRVINDDRVYRAECMYAQVHRRRRVVATRLRNVWFIQFKLCISWHSR